MPKDSPTNLDIYKNTYYIYVCVKIYCEILGKFFDSNIKFIFFMIIVDKVFVHKYTEIDV